MQVVWAWPDTLNAANTHETKAFLKTRKENAHFASWSLSFMFISSTSHKGGDKKAGPHQPEQSLPAIKNLRAAWAARRNESS